MTPRERPEAEPRKPAERGSSLNIAQGLYIVATTMPRHETIAAIKDELDAFAAARVRALLADDEATIDAIEAAWEHEPEVWTPRHAARAALAALRRKAGLE